jgi:hypothetical protein
MRALHSKLICNRSSFSVPARISAASSTPATKPLKYAARSPLPPPPPPPPCNTPQMMSPVAPPRKPSGRPGTQSLPPAPGPHPGLHPVTGTFQTAFVLFFSVAHTVQPARASPARGQQHQRRLPQDEADVGDLFACLVVDTLIHSVFSLSFIVPDSHRAFLFQFTTCAPSSPPSPLAPASSRRATT